MEAKRAVKQLISLEEHNKRVTQVNVTGGNGIACPNCGSELFDTGLSLLSYPHQYKIFCRNCNYNEHVTKSMTKIYNTQESYSVWDKRTGRKIVDCSNVEDARMMLHMDVHNRQIVKNKTLMSISFDVELTKELPTSSIAVVNKKENILNQGINKLPESQLEPIKI